ncbi:DUF479 domain-containing protein [Mangrovimicrobium sediminis]|uniref:DUF479 domain-containing protein n=1 Tax=Mangrovimicrobium sediminis TaxID=2562682 RepID=A0A4Z0M2Y6_9GAMM|nr:ACP phosphodiesterase [Haliea sp. SAOS-164]TGD73871.1 DUF479 domain-containing protein [Haliea sp. SAOS-164]
MNYLAHFHLAWPDPGLLAGALEGDYRKGPLRGELPAPIERGVRLHRAIDAFTDSHTTVARLRCEFPAELRRYAGILIDMSFDYFLSRHWNRFSAETPEHFHRGVYANLERHAQQLSPDARRMARRMAEIDLLARYRDWETVPAGAQRVGERLRRGNPFSAAAPHLEPLREPMERAFLDFYPELLEFVSAARERL